MQHARALPETAPIERRRFRVARPIGHAPDRTDLGLFVKIRLNGFFLFERVAILQAKPVTHIVDVMTDRLRPTVADHPVFRDLLAHLLGDDLRISRNARGSQLPGIVRMPAGQPERAAPDKREDNSENYSQPVHSGLLLNSAPPRRAATRTPTPDRLARAGLHVWSGL